MSTESGYDDLEELINQRGVDEVVRSLQIHLGYSPSTHIPTIDEFVESDEYLGKITNNGKGIYPYWRELLRETFPNPLSCNYDTVFLRSAIGTGKSSVARIVLLYILAKMILMENPHQFFGLLPNKDLIVYLFSLQKSTISSAMKAPLLEMIDDSPFFRKNMDLTKKGYHFKNKITIQSGTSIATNVGKDIFIAWMDELQVELYRNQNLDNYNSLKARIKSRFMLDGGVFFNSIMILSGSPGGAEGVAESLTTRAKDDTRARIDNAAQWDVLKDKIKYSGEKFKVFIGDNANEPRILNTPEEVRVYEEMSDDTLMRVIDVPVEYRKDFEDDILIAIRDLAGSVTRSAHSFITNVEKLSLGFSLTSRFFGMDVIKLPFFDDTQIKDFIKDPDKTIRSRLLNTDNYRYIHIDIGVVSDLTGISMSHVAGHIETKSFNVFDKKYTTSVDPWFINDFNIGISRNRNEETSISKITKFVIFLRDSGVNIHKVTVDGYQSTQLRQDLILAGIDCELMSVTRDSKAFDYFKQALYSERVKAPKNAHTQEEMLQFRKVVKGNGKVRVIHPTTKNSGSHGDVAESLVGSVYSAYRNSTSNVNPLSGFTNGMNTAVAHQKLAEEDEFALLQGL